jgi:uncharacterized membrane protein (UPF0136 family)
MNDAKQGTDMRTINPFRLMSTQMAGYLIIFGIFLILLGVMGYLTHPEKAHTALISGGGFGVLWMLWGILSAKGVRWSWLAALATTSLLALACVWRASVSWLAVANGQSGKAFASVIITLMLGVAVSMLFLLLKDRKGGGVERPTGGGQ